MKWLAIASLSALISSCSTFILPPPSPDDDGELYVVIVVGGDSIADYAQYADACHAYHVLTSRGIKDDNIILLMDNVVVNSPENPFPGKLFNHPSLSHDVYPGCVIDYNTTNVTPETFKNVLIGNDTNAGPVLKTTEKDRIFVFFTDHGDDGVLCFPDGNYFTTQDMDDALRQMTAKKMFKEMLLYIDCCHAGSIFEEVIPKYENVLVVTSSSAHQNAYDTYCTETLGICLGGEFSVTWLEYDDANSTSTHSLKEQYTVSKQRTTGSNVSFYGDAEFFGQKISAFQGEEGKTQVPHAEMKVHYNYETIPKPEVPMWRLQKKLEKAIEAGDQQEIARLQSEILKLQNTRRTN